MSHQSGYRGSMEMTSGTASWVTVIESWRLRYAEREHEVPVMGSALRDNPWPSIINGLAQWTARVVFLVPHDVAVIDVSIGQDVTAKFIVDRTTGADFWSGDAKMTSFDIDNPLDGPVRGTAVLTGNGVLGMTVG